MSQLNLNTVSRKGKHLTYEERIKLEALYKTRLTLSCIADQIGGRSERTIRREFARGTVELLNSDLTTRIEYSAEIGQLEHDRQGTIAVTMIGKAIVASGLTTIGGFSVLMASEFIILKDFGLMTVINISLALISTFIILPPVLVLLDRLILNKKDIKDVSNK